MQSTQQALLVATELLVKSRHLPQPSVTSPFQDVNSVCIKQTPIEKTASAPPKQRRTTQKLAEVYTLSKRNAKQGEHSFAVLVTLKSPIVFANKVRIGRLKFERNTQEAANALCCELNSIIMGKPLQLELTEAQTNQAKLLFFEHLKHHPTWHYDLRRMIRHCELTDYRTPEEAAPVPTVKEAAQVFWREHVLGLELESRMNYRNALAYALPTFGELEPAQMTERAVLNLSNGSEPLMFLKTPAKRGRTVEEEAEVLWSYSMQSRSKRPWSRYMKARFMNFLRAFKTWMHNSTDPVTGEERNWCRAWCYEQEGRKRSQRGRRHTKSETDALEAMCLRNRALTNPESQALIDVSWVAFDGKFAPFYVHALFGGTRVKETRQTKPDAFDDEDGMLSVSAGIAKTDESRENGLAPNVIIMIEALRAMGRYIESGMRPYDIQRRTIEALAGFRFNCKQTAIRALRERKRLAKLGIQLKHYDWGMPYPRNALRRTGLSMHYKLYNSESQTTQWGGNTGTVFKEYYKRLVKKEDARIFWTMVPSFLRKELKRKVPLPENHSLVPTVSRNVKQIVGDAKLAARKALATHSVAVNKRALDRVQELKERAKGYNRRAYLKRKRRSEHDAQ